MKNHLVHLFATLYDVSICYLQLCQNASLHDYGHYLLHFLMCLGNNDDLKCG
jgi:hypothetical protein